MIQFLMVLKIFLNMLVLLKWRKWEMLWFSGTVIKISMWFSEGLWRIKHLTSSDWTMEKFTWWRCCLWSSTNRLFIINFIQAFDCLSYELLISKPHAYGEDTLSLKLLHLYLTKWKQRFKLHGTYTLWSEIIFEFLQGSILEPLLFNMFLCKLFQFFHNLDIVKYTEGNTPHSTSINLNKVWYDLEKESNTLFKWFTENLLKVNLENSHILAKWTQ